MSITIFVPGDAAALALGADEVAQLALIPPVPLKATP